MLKKVVKRDFVVDKEGKKEYDRRTKKNNKTNWKEKAYLESSLNQIQTLPTVFRGND